MHTSNDLHQQFAEFFPEPALRPYAWLLSKGMSEGHICLALNELDEKLEQLPPRYRETAMRHPSELDLVARDGKEDQPFILHREKLYLQRYFRYESRCLTRILEFLSKEQSVLDARMDDLLARKDLIQKLFPEGNSLGPDWQLAAALSAVLNNFSIITGGPGTGKTTTVACLLGILYDTNPALKVALAAPTGKAAARMAESLRNNRLEGLAGFEERLAGLIPSTIHRLLRRKKGTPHFQHNASFPLPVDVVIVDEASMIDVALFAKLLDAIGPDTRLILLGDKDQLASVEAGSLFGDLCISSDAVNRFSERRLSLFNAMAAGSNHGYPEESHLSGVSHPLTGHIVELKYSHRFSNEAGIGKLSRAVLQNDREALEAVMENGAEEIQFDFGFDPHLFEQFVAGYRSYIEEQNVQQSLKKFANLRVLCAVREGPQGLYALNKAIEARLSELKLIDPRSVYYLHRPIILTRNYYEHGLFNGDTGILRLDESGMMMACFEDSTGALKKVAPGFLDAVETSFAMTIHKSQGSEFSEVLMVLPKQGAGSLLTRELLYTGITRAKKRVLIQTSKDAFESAMAKRVERASGISARLENASF